MSSKSGNRGATEHRTYRGTRTFRAFIPLYLISLSLLPFNVFAQSKQKEIIAFTGGAGVLTFHGDVGTNSFAGAYSYIRTGYSFSVEKYLGKSLAFSLNFLDGKIARDEKSSDNVPKLNFESPFMQFGISGTFLMRAKEEKKQSLVIPYISAGLAWTMFDPRGDLRDADGNLYYYWKDGSMKDLPETGPNFFYAKDINRDYKYETKLEDSIAYSRASMTVPVSAGVKLKVSKHLDANLGFTYHFAFTDYLDNVKSGGNDQFLFTSGSLTWHFLKRAGEKPSNIDFAMIDRMDSDHDGVIDVNDVCPGSPRGWKVDPKGCPEDGDADGVPDYVDKDRKTKSGAAVDENGVELTRAQLAKLQKERNSNTAELRSRAVVSSDEFNKKPSAEFMKEVEAMQQELRKNPTAKTSSVGIPGDLQVADWNKDGFVSSEEIAKTIDAFFDGTIIFSAEQIHRLIDFFFEQ